ncbi:hypothetical protein PG999_003524 [Apiospora kogelbergensis]|uniref:Zn(2)-C6 fungal-type domain-containing protein n=1 Tax=Apiospora kogelbergensis TaxID=1337665 RepID=A0AAW0R3X1_9PEZI
MAATPGQLPLVTAPVATLAPPHNPRKRGRTACTRCKNRKQKCDDQWPICSNCRKAATECDKTAVTEDEPPAAYTRALEERIAFLESRVTELNGHQLQQEEQKQRQHHPSVSQFPPRRNSNALGEVVELLSMGNFEAPAYIGSSSGLNLALNLGEMVQATVWNKALPNKRGERNDSSSPRSHKRRKSSVAGTSFSGGDGSSPTTATTYGSTPAPTPTKTITMDEVIANSAGPPSDELGLSILAAYFSQIHPRYPFLDPDEVWALHCERAALAVTPIPHLTKQQRFGIFKLYMVYAIGAMLLQLTDKHTSSPPESYYMSALQHIFAARESRTTQNIEAMALLVLYHLRSPSSFGIWYMIGLAMRTSIDLGLHMRRNEDKLADGGEIQMRRRLFWSVYALERIIAISMGRPFSIPDRQIDVELPEDDICPGTGSKTEKGEDYEDWPSGSSRIPEEATSYNGGGTWGVPRSYPASWKTSLTSAIFLFKLRRMESRIQHSVYRTDNTTRSSIKKNSSSSSSSTNNNELNYMLLHYHRAIRLLVQPFLALLPPTDPYYALCLSSAGEICQSHKRLHQTLDYGHSFIAVQTVFVAGITLLYGLWTHPSHTWSVRLADDVRACSLVLFVMGERASWVRKYRDAFELLVSAAMEKLQQQRGHDDGTEGVGGDGVADDLLLVGDTAAVDRPATPEAAALAQDAAEETVVVATEPVQDEQKCQQQHSILSQMSPGGGDHEAWRVVAELASWIDQDKDHSPVWMPDFETLQGLS